MEYKSSRGQLYNLSVLFFLIIILICTLIACQPANPDLAVNARLANLPLRAGNENTAALVLEVIPKGESPTTIEEIHLVVDGTGAEESIREIKVFQTPADSQGKEPIPFGEPAEPRSNIVFSGYLEVKDTTLLMVALSMNDNVDLSGKIWISINKLVTTSGTVKVANSDAEDFLRFGIALRRHNDDGVHTYRIPGLTTTNNGTLLAVYDARRESARDMQGHMDIGLSRSTDGGISWEPMQVVLDMGTWGGLPEKFNGVSDACILVDQNTNDIYVAGLWMHGVINSDGVWVEGLTENSTEWNHQWRDKGSQPGFDVRQTSQFLITKSGDDGTSWSDPVNITRMGKKEEWWLWAPAPGHGITLDDGTLVFPTQGRDHTGMSFSNITYSKDGGKTWSSTEPACLNSTECMAVQLTDGSIMLNMRHNENRNNLTANNGRAVAVTRDLGKTWTDHPTSRNTLIEPTCMASIHKHNYSVDGEKKSILLFSNPESRTQRENMTIKVSFDDGLTWPEENKVLLDAGRGRGYSCLTSIDENTIGILYESSQADLVFQRIPLKDLLGK